MFAERFNKLLTYNKINANRLAMKIGTTRATIANICDGKHSPSVDKIESLLSVWPDLNLDWLITGRGKMYLNETPDGATVVEEPSQSYEVNAMTDLREEISYLKEQVTTLRKLNQLYEEKISRLEATHQPEQQPSGKKNAL